MASEQDGIIPTTTVECDTGQVRALIHYHCEIILVWLDMQTFGRVAVEAIDRHTTAIQALSGELADMLSHTAHDLDA
jgi:hypothetical protein